MTMEDIYVKFEVVDSEFEGLLLPKEEAACQEEDDLLQQNGAATSDKPQTNLNKVGKKSKAQLYSAVEGLTIPADEHKRKAVYKLLKQYEVAARSKQPSNKDSTAFIKVKPCYPVTSYNINGVEIKTERDVNTNDVSTKIETAEARGAKLGKIGKEISLVLSSLPKPQWHGYQCTVCDRRTTTFHCMKMHMTAQHSRHPSQRQNPIGIQFECETCDTTLLSVYNLKKHMKRCHFNHPPQHPVMEYLCKICGKKSENIAILRFHMEKVHCVSLSDVSKQQVPDDVVMSTCISSRIKDTKCRRKRRRQCPICGKLLSSGPNLRRHVKNVHKTDMRTASNTSNSNTSNNSNASNSNSNSNISSNTNNTYSNISNKTNNTPNDTETNNLHCCSVCGKTFLNAAGLSSHTHFRHPTSQPVVCSVYGTQFSNTQSVQKHTLDKHAVGRTSKNSTFRCPLCATRFRRHIRLRNHIRMKHKGPPFACFLCCKTFLDHETFISHMQDIRHLVCTICYKVFSKRDNFDTHVQLMHNSVVQQNESAQQKQDGEPTKQQQQDGEPAQQQDGASANVRQCVQ